MTKTGLSFGVLAAVLMAAITAAAPAAAQGRDREQTKRSAAVAKPATAGELLDQLAAASDEAAARGIATRIERLWRRSGSDTVDLLMSRFTVAMQAKDYPLAIELIDRAIALRPDWAEGYSTRATALYVAGDYQRAMLDLNEALRREPRHFNALAGVGIIYQAYGDKKGAMAAFRKALAIHPHLDMVKRAVERLAPDVDGQDL